MNDTSCRCTTIPTINKMTLHYAMLFLESYIPELERDTENCSDELVKPLLEQRLKEVKADYTLLLEECI